MQAVASIPRETAVFSILNRRALFAEQRRRSDGILMKLLVFKMLPNLRPQNMPTTRLYEN